MRRGGFASRDAVREGLRQLQELDGFGADPAVLTAAEWLERWLATRTRLRPRTRTSYAEHIHRCLKPHLGGMLLDELTPARVKEAFEYISQYTTPRGEPLSAATVQAMLGHASIVLTADTYASVLPEVAREAAERTAWLVLRDSGKVVGTGGHEV